MLIHDTDQLPTQRRAAAITAVLSEPGLATAVTHTEAPRMRLESWNLGSLTVSRVSSTAMRVVRTSRARSATTAPAIALGVYAAGVLRQTQFDQEVHTDAGEMFLMDAGAAHDHAISGPAVEGCAIHVPMKDLGLARETVKIARHNLHGSPFYALLRGHLLTLVDTAEDASQSSVAASVERATVDLVRTLVISAAGEDAAERIAPVDDLLASIKRYVASHLQDPSLNAARIARAHHISVRHLYKVCAEGGIRLGEWTMSSRLDGVKAALGDPTESHRTIFEIASQWGFVDASHFSARFRMAYGSTARQWRDEALRASTYHGRSATASLST